MTTSHDPESAQAFIRAHLKITRQRIAIAKSIIVRKAEARTRAEDLIVAVLTEYGGPLTNKVSLLPDTDSTAALTAVAEALAWQVCSQEAILSLIHSGYLMAAGDLWIARTSVGFETGSLGSGWKFEELEVPIPSSLWRSPSGGGENEFMADPDLYLLRLEIENMHEDIAAALSEAVRCFRSELYTAALAMLGKASEGGWLELGESLLNFAARDGDVAMFGKQRSVLEDPQAGALKKFRAVVEMFNRQDIFKPVVEKSGIRPKELEAVILWSDTVRESRNTIHFRVSAATPNTYEKVASLLLATPQNIRVLYRLKETTDQLVP